MSRKTLAVIALLALQACVTRKQVRNAPSDAGVAASYAASWDRVKLAARDAISGAGFEVKEEVPLETRRLRLLGTQGLSSGTAGRIARVILEDRGAECAVWVLVESKVDSRQTEPADEALARLIQDKIAAALSLPPPPAPDSKSSAPEPAGAERTFRSPAPLCLEAAGKACRARDLRVFEENRGNGQGGKVLAEGRGLTASVLVDRDAEGRAKVAVYVRGRSSAVENREEAQRLLDKIREALKEPE